MLRVDHVDLNVSDLQKSEGFYDLVSEKLGLRKTLHSEDVVVYTDGDFGLYLIPADDGKNYDPSRGGLNHLAFKAATRDEVDDFYDFLRSREIEVVAPPRESVDYPEGYYSFFFRDPDRIPLEFTFCPKR